MKNGHSYLYDVSISRGDITRRVVFYEHACGNIAL